MRLKVVLAGLLLSLLVTLPVLAISARNTQRSRALSVIDYSDGTPTTNFANWTVSPTMWTLCFGAGTGNDVEFLDEGLRIDAAARQQAESFSFDIQSNTNETPFVEIWVNVPGTPNPVPFIDTPVSDLPSIDGFTLTQLHNGFLRIKFNASQSTLPSGTTFSAIYYADFLEGSDESFNDKITNVFVNNLPVAPNVQPTPEFDSTLLLE